MRSIPEGCGTDTGPGRQCPGQMAGRQDAEGTGGDHKGAASRA